MSAGAAVRVLDHGTILDLLAYHGLAQEQPLELVRRIQRPRLVPAPVVALTGETRVTHGSDGTYGITRTEGITWWTSRRWT